MSDLLLPTIPGNPQKRPKTPTSNSKQKQGQKSPAHNHAATLSVIKVARGMGNLVLSWRDGLAESEREDRRRTEERKQILAVRMQNVRHCHLVPFGPDSN